MSAVTQKGQVTIPKAIRSALGLRPGVRVEFELRGGEAVLRKKIERATIEQWRGYLKRQVDLTTDEFIRRLRGE